MRTLLLHQHQDAVVRYMLDWSKSQAEPLALTPSLQAGRDLRKTVGGLGKTVTLTQQARLALRDRGWQLLAAGDRLSLMLDVLAGLTLDYLGPLLERPGTADTLLNLMGEFVRGDLEPEQVKAVAATLREHDVARVFAAWVGHCVEHRIFDAVSAEYFAARFAAITPRPYLVHGFAHFDAAQVHWLNLLLGDGSLVTLPYKAQGVGLQRTGLSVDDLTQRGFEVLDLPAGPSRRVGPQVMQGYVSSSLPHPAPLTRLEAAGIEGEVRACLRQVRTWLAAGIPAERIAVVTGNEEAYLGTLADVALEYRLPLISGQHIPLRSTPLGSLLGAWIEAHEQEWRFSRTRRLLTHPLMHWPTDLGLIARRLQQAAPSGLRPWEKDLEWLMLPPVTTWPTALGVIRPPAKVPRYPA